MRCMQHGCRKASAKLSIWCEDHLKEERKCKTVHQQRAAEAAKVAGLNIVEVEPARSRFIKWMLSYQSDRRSHARELVMSDKTWRWVVSAVIEPTTAYMQEPHLRTEYGKQIMGVPVHTLDKVHNGVIVLTVEHRANVWDVVAAMYFSEAADS